MPEVEGTRGASGAAARQLDVALMSVGFKCSLELLEHLSSWHPTVAVEAGDAVLQAARGLVGDHVDHNPYFIDFPRNVPSTLEFWTTCITMALMDPRAAANVAEQLQSGPVNLLDLPTYGRYQHRFEEMLAAHDPLMLNAKGRVTVLHLGGSLESESHAAYLALAGSPAPLSEVDLSLVGALAALHVRDEQPERVDVRENRAVINHARLTEGLPLLVDTPVDVLRVACAISQGDVTLSTPTRFRGLRRSHRRALLSALDGVVATNPAKLADVPRYAEPLKRLGESLHPHEYPMWGSAQDVFAVARGDLDARSLAGRVELALKNHRTDEAVALLRHAPGMLLRSVDRLARTGADMDGLVSAVRDSAPSVSTRVLLSLREHLLNRLDADPARIFVNQSGRAWVSADERPPLSAATIDALNEVLDTELAQRLPDIARLIIDPDARAIAVPLSGKARPGGFGILPRGSVQAVGSRIRFFVYWKEHRRTTDYDLSVLLLDEHFEAAGQVSWTNLTDTGAVHSGDLTESSAGATEFIDLDLAQIEAAYVVPQVNIYSGEGFSQVEEAFFGFMEREPGDEGRPFEPRTVRAKSDLLGPGRVALPLLFGRTADAGWQALWMHLNLFGYPSFNRVEANAFGTWVIAQAIVERKYLRLDYLEVLLRSRGVEIYESPTEAGSGPISFLGLEVPEDLPPGSAAYTLRNFGDLLNSA